MNVKTIKYPAGSAIKLVWFLNKPHLQEVEYGDIWRVWLQGFGWHQTY